MHMTLDFDEYMHPTHQIYDEFKQKSFSKKQWSSLIKRIQQNNKEIMILFNDTKAVEYGMRFMPEYVEVHATCLNDPYLLDSLKSNININTFVVFGIGGNSLYEIENALKRIEHQNVVLMFGFQNYPTRYKDINFKKMQKIMNLFPEFSYGYADHTAWDEPNNILITIMGASLGMNYIEKHVTNIYGDERVDWNSAVSIDMFNEIADKLGILNNCRGDGLLKLNDGEEKYSLCGPMKKTAVLKVDVRRGDVLSMDKIRFLRTGETTDFSQLDAIKSVGCEINKDLRAGSILFRNHLRGMK